MENFKIKLIDFAKCDSGSTSLEYSLITGTVCSTLIFALDGIKVDITTVFKNIGRVMVEATQFRN